MTLLEPVADSAEPIAALAVIAPPALGWRKGSIERSFALPHRTDGARLRSILAVHRHGNDATTRLGPAEFARATLTPEGPATLHLSWLHGEIRAAAWGPGAELLLDLVPDFCAHHDQRPVIDPMHQAVGEALQRHEVPLIGRCRNLWHTLAPFVIEQRVTMGEAVKSWRRICRRFGEPAPGPFGLTLPPTPEAIAQTPYWVFHKLGVERKRADALVSLARHARLLHELDAADDIATAEAQLWKIPGIGRWTTGVGLGPALGCPDSIAVGDYWLKHIVVWALAGRPRGTDEEMLELLAPYAGNRARVVSILRQNGWGVPRYTGGQRILPMSQW